MVKKPIQLSDQCLEIYLLFKERLGRGVTPEDITDRDRLNIKEYTGRISDLRKFGYGIKNLKKNFYVLKTEPEMGHSDIVFIRIQANLRGYENLVKRCDARLEIMEALF